MPAVKSNDDTSCLAGAAVADNANVSNVPGEIAFHKNLQSEGRPEGFRRKT